MARVIDTHPDSGGVVRSVKVTAGTATLDRPIEKLCTAVGTKSMKTEEISARGAVKIKEIEAFKLFLEN